MKFALDTSYTTPCLRATVWAWK